MRYIICLLMVVCTSLPAYAINENDALALSLADLKTIPEEDQCYTRYVWVTNAIFKHAQCVSLTNGYISRNEIISRPLPLGKDKLMVMRIDLRSLASIHTKDLQQIVDLWEELKYDPRFNYLITKDTLKFLDPKFRPQLITKKQVLIPCEPYIKDGYTYSQKWVWKQVYAFDDGIDIIRIVADHFNKTTYAELVELTKSQAPIVNHRYFITRALSTIQDKGVYKTIYGGLYYDFSGIRNVTKGKKGTDEDKFFELLGIGNVEAGITAKKVFEKLRSDQRVGLFRSDVTGRPRQAEFLKTLLSRDAESIVSVTHDIRAQDIDVGNHAMMNLLEFKDFARETIYVKQTGLHGFVLFDGNGALKDEVPPDVAGDYTMPVPYGFRLEPAIGCIRCHRKEGGWRKIENQVKKLTSKYLDIFRDKNFTFDPRFRKDVIRLAGLYGGEPELKLLPRSRDDYANAILRFTGPWKESKDQTDLVNLSGLALEEIYKEYRYTTVTAVTALQELNIEWKNNRKFKTPAEEIKAASEELKNRLKVSVVTIGGIIPEDVRIGALLSELAINRTDWDLVYSFVAARVRKEK